MQSVVKLSGATSRSTDSYPFSEVIALAPEKQQMALLALSHTKLEHLIYEVMLAKTMDTKTRVGEFSISDLMTRTGCGSYGNVRRARAGLNQKMSIDRQKVAGCSSRGAIVYLVYTPREIFLRRQTAGLCPFPKELISATDPEIASSGEIFERLVEKHSLTRREVQVALRCAEGLTNAKIGERLFIQEETVKFHLRNIYLKFGVKRRTELMVHLLRHVP